MALIIIAIIVIVLAAAVMMFAGLKRRSSEKGTGRLSGRTRRTDKQARKISSYTGREFEEQALQVAEPSTELAPEEQELLETAVYIEPDADAVGVTRRQFLNRSVIGLAGFGLAGFGGSVLAFLWPSFSSGFGSKINLGAVSDVKQQIKDNNNFFYVPEGRMWVTEYPVGSIEKARATYSAPELEGMEQGLIALYQKCPHLGCRVPECVSSQWFECPCHGSQYNRVGEKRGGPAPRGLDRFAMLVNNQGEFIVDTGTIIQGPPIGTNTTGQEAEGPNCIGEASE